MREPNIKVDRVYPPIPIRSFDYCAYDDNSYDGPGSVLGHGSTEAEARQDFIVQWEERYGKPAVKECALEVENGCDPANTLPCGKPTFAQCSDCGLHICHFHGEICCGKAFCNSDSCLGEHQKSSEHAEFQAGQYTGTEIADLVELVEKVGG